MLILLKSYPTEMQATGAAGSVLILDSRTWHATAPNRTDKPRVGMAVRYAPWWLNLDVLMPGSDERARIVDETGGNENEVAAVSPAIYECTTRGCQTTLSALGKVSSRRTPSLRIQSFYRFFFTIKRFKLFD